MNSLNRSSERYERGWRIITIENDQLTVEILPDRGATILSVRENAGGSEFMWRPRWGLRPRDAPDIPGSSEAVSMGQYSGGWSSLFPNAGGVSMEHGVEWPMHGEVWLASFDGTVDRSGFVGRTTLVRSPFHFVKQIEIEGNSILVSESATNVGGSDIEVIWNQHVTFAAPLLGPDCVISSSGKLVFADIADPRVDSAHIRSQWPMHLPPGEQPVDLSRVPPARSAQKRRAFLTGFEGPNASVTVVNQRTNLMAEIRWDASDFPFAWYWLEAGGREGFPWFGTEYVLGIEPCTSYPSAGIGAVRNLTGTQVTIPAGVGSTRSVRVTFGIQG